MPKKKKDGPVHSMPSDLKKALSGNPKAKVIWDTLTPLAQNEFICWVISPVQTVTRERRVRRTLEELLEGKRRPCCWPGCPHR